jgi:hypothetical protein
MQREEGLIKDEIQNEENEQNKREERQNETENKTKSDIEIEIEQNKISIVELMEYIDPDQGLKKEDLEKGKQNSPDPKNELNVTNFQSAGTIATNNFSNTVKSSKKQKKLKKDEDLEKGKQNSPGPKNELNVTNFQSAGTIATNNFSNTVKSSKKKNKIINDYSSSSSSSSSSGSKNALITQKITNKNSRKRLKINKSSQKNTASHKKKENNEEEIVNLIENLAKMIKGHEKKKELTAKFVENFDDNSTDLQDFINAGQRFLRKRKRKVSLDLFFLILIF